MLTLRQYFPSASIVGAELNTRSLARCKELEVDAGITFVYSDHDLIARHGPFDAVFCMAVLQRGPHEVQRSGVTNLARIYPFEKFDREVDALDALLAQDGLLVIHHSQYDLRDASAAAKYEALETGPSDGLPRFARNGDLKPPSSEMASIFVKRRG